MTPPERLPMNTEYFNRTPNKSPRSPSKTYIAVVWHETESGSLDPRDTLTYNLRRAIGSSYHYLIARDGTIFAYVDPHEFTAWHTGNASFSVDGKTFKGFACNEAAIGVELDGPNNGTPIPAAQLASAAQLLNQLHEQFGIVRDRSHNVTHAEIARPIGRKTDPQCCKPEQILAAAGVTVPVPITKMVYYATTTAANVREGPARSFAVVMVMPANTIAGYDGVTEGESIGGNSVWLHRADEIGFVHSSILRRS